MDTHEGFIWNKNPNPNNEQPDVRWDFFSIQVEIKDYSNTIARLKKYGCYIRHIIPPIPNKPSYDLTNLGFKLHPDQKPDPDLRYVIKGYQPRPTQKNFCSPKNFSKIQANFF